MQYDIKNKIKFITELKNIVKEDKKNGYKVGFVNGCFDLIHSGHVSLLEEASRHCDKLILALNSDSSIKIIKGEKRPVYDQKIRSKILSSIVFIDYIVIFYEQNPCRILNEIQPDVIIKANDYNLEKILECEREYLKNFNAKIEFINLADNISTTNTIKKIKEQH